MKLFSGQQDKQYLVETQFILQGIVLSLGRRKRGGIRRNRRHL